MNFITGDSVPVPVGSASAIPSIDNRYDIGSSTKRWRDGRFVNLYAGSTNVGGELTSLDTRVDTLEGKGAGVTQAYVDAGDALQLNLEGGALTGQVTTTQTATLGTQLVHKAYVDTADALQLNLTGGALTGQVTTNQTPSASTQLVPKSYVDTFLPKVGGALTGQVTTNQTPSASDQLVPKSYVDTADALKLNLTGGTMTGVITLGTAGQIALGTNNITGTTGLIQGFNIPALDVRITTAQTTAADAGIGLKCLVFGMDDKVANGAGLGGIKYFVVDGTAVNIQAVTTVESTFKSPTGGTIKSFTFLSSLSDPSAVLSIIKNGTAVYTSAAGLLNTESGIVSGLNVSFVAGDLIRVYTNLGTVYIGKSIVVVGYK